jgi:hypothetical protein
MPDTATETIPNNGSFITRRDDHPGAQRFHIRRSVQTPADFPPGEPEVSSVRPALPKPESLPAVYEGPFARIEKYFPLKAAYLRDLQQRALNSIENYRRVYREEEERLQNHNEEARRASICIDRQINEYWNECSSVLTELQSKIDKARVDWEEQRQLVAEYKIRCGFMLDADLKNSDPLDEDDPSLEEPSPNPSAGIASEADEAQNKGMFDRIKSFVRREDQKQTDASASQPTTAGQSLVPAPPAAEEMVVSHADDAYLQTLISRLKEVTDPATLSIGITVPYPIEQADEQVAPPEVVAVKLGLPYPELFENNQGGGGQEGAFSLVRAVAAAIGRGVAYLGKQIPLLVFGTIFGLSLGLVIGIIEAANFGRIGRYSVQLAGLSVIGCGILSVVAKTLTHITHLLCEYVYSTALASSIDAVQRYERFVRKLAWTLLFVLLFSSAVFIAIEANVERHGIVQSFASKMENSLLQRGGQAPAAENNNFAFWSIALVASVPFVFFYISAAWRETRAGVIRAYVLARRGEMVAERAEKLYEAKVELAARYWEFDRKHLLGITQDRINGILQEIKAAALPKPVSPPESTSPAEPAAEDPQSSAAEEQPSGAGTTQAEPATQTAYESRAEADPEAEAQSASEAVPSEIQPIADPSHGSVALYSPTQLAAETQQMPSDPTELRVKYWKAKTAKDDIRARWDELRAKRKQIEDDYASRIHRVEQNRTHELTELPAQSYERCRAAYRTAEAACQLFRDEYLAIAQVVEKRRRGGLFSRVREFLAAKPEADYPR